MSETDDLVAALAPVAAAFDDQRIRFYVSGSVASSLHGAIRSTMDVDLVCDLCEDQIERFVDVVGDEFYISPSAIRHAVYRKSCFNLIHLPTSYKVDVFVTRGRPFDISSMDRATLQTFGASNAISVPVCTAEDSIISKLEWFRLTNEVSERQWGDVTRLMHLLGDTMDVPYLQQMAESVGIEDLLQRLLSHE